MTPKRRLFHRHDQIPRLIFPLHVYDRSIRIRPLLYGYPRHGPWAAWAISASNIGLVFAQAGPPWLWVLCCWPAARSAPWPWSHSDSPAKPASNDAKTTSPTSPKSSASQTDAEALKQVMAELQQVGALDPAAQDKLMADLKQVDPSLWPMVLQTFRAEAAYKRREEQREAGRKKEESTAASTPREGGGAITQVSSEQETRFELNSASFTGPGTNGDNQPSPPALPGARGVNRPHPSPSPEYGRGEQIALTPCPSPEYGRGEQIALTPGPSPEYGRGENGCPTL